MHAMHGLRGWIVPQTGAASGCVAAVSKVRVCGPLSVTHSADTVKFVDSWRYEVLTLALPLYLYDSFKMLNKRKFFFITYLVLFRFSPSNVFTSVPGT